MIYHGIRHTFNAFRIKDEQICDLQTNCLRSFIIKNINHIHDVHIHDFITTLDM